ncbi:MAG: type II toxin-antitoxin system YoeB family toxin [Firmicutes bacterium]|nr:type II toxin-antitoxin system YoeB family toxin [Bacillota bacterium]
MERSGVLNGIGEPEALKGDLRGEYSRRINEKDRLLYHTEGDRIYKGHYDE